MARVRIFKHTAGACDAARRALRKRREPLLAVFDVDSTLLGAGRRRIAAVCDLLRWIVGAGGAVHVVTARPEDSRQDTAAELDAVGVGRHIEGLHMPPARLGSTAAISHWKAAARRGIAARAGRQLSISVGDNLHDLAHVPFRDTGHAALLGGRHTQLGLLVKDGSRDRRR